jgi:hypothetical protein
MIILKAHGVYEVGGFMTDGTVLRAAPNEWSTGWNLNVQRKAKDTWREMQLESSETTW